jgi:hypothetical protein
MMGVMGGTVGVVGRIESWRARRDGSVIGNACMHPQSGQNNQCVRA